MGNSGEALAAGQFYSTVACRRSCGDTVLSELRHDRRRQFPHHCHERAYFGLLLAGSYTEHLGGRTYAHGPMSLAFHPPGMDHHDEVETRGTRLLTIEVGDALLDRLREESRPAIGFKVFSGGEPVRLSARLYRELRRGEPGADLDVEELLFDLLASSLCRPGVDETREPAWLRRIEALLRESFREPLSLDHLAAEAGVHPGHLTRTFRRFRGYTPGEYLQHLRVRRVCEGLAHPDLSLVDLALEAGFADQSHCTRVFHRLVGLPPGAFRETLASSG